MTPALLWLTADLVPLIMGAAAATFGLLAWAIQAEHTHRANKRADRAEQVAETRSLIIAARDQRIDALVDWVSRLEQQQHTTGDEHALARHLSAAANQGLLPKEKWN